MTNHTKRIDNSIHELSQLVRLYSTVLHVVTSDAVIRTVEGTLLPFGNKYETYYDIEDSYFQEIYGESDTT